MRKVGCVPRIPMTELIYSIDQSPRFAWQAELLDWSVRRVGMDCRITRLTALHPDQSEYLCLNRWWAILNQWKESEAETVVILDPDMVFVRPLNVTAKRGQIIGSPYPYVYDLVWCPVVLHRDHVREWAFKTMALAQLLAQHGIGWVSEIWAANICATRLCLQLERRELGIPNWSGGVGDASVIHYCYQRSGFSKNDYRPGHHVECPDSDEVHRILAELINECFGSKST
jgi:hypothetical protein